MSISTIWDKLSMAATSAVFIALGTVSAAPASAITFNFLGSFGDAPSFAGSITLDNDFLDTFIENSFKGLGFELKEPNLRAFDPSGSFSLTVDGNTISSSSGLTIRRYVALNGPLAISRGFFTRIGTNFDLYIAPDQCLQGLVCSGGLFFENLGSFDFPVTASNEPPTPNPVPEPTAAIALGVIGASMLIRKRKLSSSPHA